MGLRMDWGVSVALLGLTAVLSGCGGGDGSSGPPAPVAAAPAPTPSPTPSPPPSPSSLSARLGPPLLTILQPGDQIEGPIVCASGTLSYATDTDGTIRLASLSAISQADNDNFLHIQYGGTDRFTFDVNGFGGSSFVPGDKRPSEIPSFLEYRKSDDQMQIAFVPLAYGTVGFLALATSQFCFFAAGPGFTAASTSGQLDNSAAIADGLAVVTGRPYRLTTDRVIGSWNASGSAIDLQLTLTPRLPAFGVTDPSGPKAIGPIRLQRANGETKLWIGVAEERATGTLDCVLQQGGVGIACAFELRTEAGDRFVGAVAGDARLI